MGGTDDDEAEGFGDIASSIEEKSISYLSDLADEVRERRFPTQPPEGERESREASSSEDSTLTDDPLEAVRELLAERRPQFAPRPDTDSGTEKGHRMVYIGVGLAVALLFTGVLVIAGPQQRAAVDQDHSALDDPLATISLSANDAAFMNRVFRESSHEVAYCGIIDTEGDPSRMEVWLADTVSSSPGQIQFRTNNCPMANREVLLHTHPNGGLALSETDRATLESQPEAYMCVQAGRLTEESGAVLDNLACYYEGQSDGRISQPARVPVEITET